MHGFFEGVQNFGQGLIIIVSRLCTLEKWDRKHETARKARNLRVVESYGQGPKQLTEPLGKTLAAPFT